MYRRRFYRRYPKSAKQNYQIERPYFTIPGTSGGGYVTVIDPATVTGVRKVKNFSIQFQSKAIAHSVIWALVYVPAGYNPNELILSGEEITTMYKPTQNVIMAGIYDPQDPSGTRRFTRISRLLKEGDGIALVYAVSQTPTPFSFIVTYAITL